MAPSELAALQLRRLRGSVGRARRSAFYGRHAAALGGDIGALDDLRRLPFTTKEDLRGRYPFGFLAVPRAEAVRLHATSGTTGDPAAMLYTRRDLDAWSDLCARSLFGAGLTAEDVFQNIAGYGLFTGGLGFHQGAERMGMLVIPAGAGNSRRQIKLMRDLGTTAVHIMPSFALYLMRAFEELGLDPRTETRLTTILLGAEPHSRETRDRIEQFYGVAAYNSYGLTEMGGPGVSFECPEKAGLHVWEDHFLLEVLAPDGDAPAAAGEPGELVFTSLTREAMPLIRYRSRDLATLIPEPCPCGRTHRRISRLQGRLDDLVIFKGVNLYPLQVERVLAGFPQLAEDFFIHLDRVAGADRMTIEAVVKDDALLVGADSAEDLRRRMTEALKSSLLVTPEVRLRGVGDDPEPARKPRRVIDNRTL